MFAMLCCQIVPNDVAMARIPKGMGYSVCCVSGADFGAIQFLMIVLILTNIATNNKPSR
jgi:hypothetical protein